MLRAGGKHAAAGLKVSCSWEVANEKSILDTITLDTSFKRGEKEDLEHIVSLDTCINLINRNVESRYLKLKLSVLQTWQIKKISVVSEARIIEIYGKYEEYMTTCRAEFFDECENMSVYVAEAVLPEPYFECTLKFARLRRKDKIWLYGIHVSVEKAVISLDTVPDLYEMMKDSDRICKNITKRCKLVKLFGSFLDPTKTKSKGPDHEILESEYRAQQSPLSAGAKSASECLTEILPGFSMSAKEKHANEDEATDTNNTGCSKEMDVSLKLPHVIDALKKHIDGRFSEYERQMADIVEEKLMELEWKQNEKLDQIIRSLEDLKSSLNIRGPEG